MRSQPGSFMFVVGNNKADLAAASTVFTPYSTVGTASNKLTFYNLAGFVNVIGAVDGTHV